MARRLPALGLALTLVVALGGCGRADQDAAETNSRVLTVYASLPLSGPRAAESEATANGERLALHEAGGRVGALTIKYVALDDSTPGSQGWDPEQTASNAQIAVRDKTAIAYLGDSDSGATAISLPILNEAGIAQITPLSTYSGLTRDDGGADKGEPDRFYPAKTRTLARVIPPDSVQADAQLDLMERSGCRSLALIDDRGLYGRGLAEAVQLDAQAAKTPTLSGRESLRPDAKPTSVAKDVVGSRPTCAFYAGDATATAAPILDALAAADPTVELFVPDQFASDVVVGALDPAVRARLHLTLPTPKPARLPAAAEDFAAAYRRTFGAAPLAGAYYGYEAMKLALRAINDAGRGGNNRTDVVRALLAVRGRDSILGRYSLDRYGDTSIARYGEADVRGSAVHVVREILAAPGEPVTVVP